MKFTTIVIMKTEKGILDNIRKRLPEESKVYPSEAILNTASLLPDVNMLDKQSVSKALAELTDSASGVDDNGVYLMSTLFKDSLIEQCNKKIKKPISKLNICDDYSVFDLDMTDDLLNYVDGYDRFPDAILMPDLSLIRATGELSDWKNKFKEILKQYSDNSFSLILDCHV